MVKEYKKIKLQVDSCLPLIGVFDVGLSFVLHLILSLSLSHSHTYEMKVYTLSLQPVIIYSPLCCFKPVCCFFNMPHFVFHG